MLELCWSIHINTEHVGVKCVKLACRTYPEPLEPLTDQEISFTKGLNHYQQLLQFANQYPRPRKDVVQ